MLVLTGCSADGAPPTQTEAPSTEASPDDAEPAAYVALGDSFTAAPGVPEPAEDAAGCGRSSSNYPSLVAAELGLTLEDVSCSGADTLALVGSQETSAGPVPPQFLAVTAQTRLVTLGMGGNDEGLFRSLVEDCLGLASPDVTGAPCRASMTVGGIDTALARIEVIGARLTSALVGLQDRAPNADVVLVGYPQLVPAVGQCDILPLAEGDYAYVRELTVALGAATAKAAADAGVLYVDVLAASDGHDVCAGEAAWVNGIANDTGRSAAPLHPFAEEQTAVADLVLEALAATA